MTEEMIPVALQDPMGFACNAENDCFNDCCRDLNQALTPYDVLRLKNFLGLSSTDFLKKYTSRHHGPDSGLPVIEFKSNPATGNACPFVRPEGCSVYTHRPASCRMYPLARAIARSRETGAVSEYFALIEEPHCKGFGKESGKSVAQWLKGQDVGEYNKENDKLLELISLKNQILPGKLEGFLADEFYQALYDLDTFRTRIFKETVLGDVSLSPDLMGKIKSDDNALLDLGLGWVKYRLFGIKMMIGD